MSVSRRRPARRKCRATSAARLLLSRSRRAPPGNVRVMDDLPPRLRAVCDLDVAEVREYSGRQKYDGTIQDLSPDGVRQGLRRLSEAAASGPLDDPHDEAHLRAFEQRARVAFGDLELHRRSPLPHLDGLDLACYDRDYAPASERDRARLEHLARGPRAVDRPVAAPADAPADTRAAAAAAHARLASHVERAATDGDPDPSLGEAGLTALMSSADGMDVDLGRLAGRRAAERDGSVPLPAAGAARIHAARPPLEVARDLVRDHPGPDGVIDAAR